MTCAPPPRSVRSDQAICVDFDGTLRGADGVAQPGAEDALRRLADGGFTILLSSARLGRVWSGVQHRRRDALRAWCAARQLRVDAVCIRNPAASVRIDDRGLHHAGDWNRTLAALARACPVSPRTQRRPTIVVFHDGPLRSGDAPVHGAREACAELVRSGRRLLVAVTADDAEPFAAIDDRLHRSREWLRRAGFLEPRCAVEDVVATKEPADVYVDSGSIRFTGDWEAVVASLLARRE